MRLKSLYTALIVALLVFTTACNTGTTETGSGSSEGRTQSSSGSGSNQQSSGSEQGGGDDSEPEEQITLRVAWWGGQERHDNTLKVIEMYEQQNPHVKIEAEFSSYDGYWERMAAQAAGNNLPDVMNQNYGEYLTQYTERGLLYDMTEFLDDGTIDTSSIDDSIIESGMVNGEFVAMSLGTNARAVLYDPALFEQAGAKMPELGWTWDDVEEAGRKISQVTAYGINNLETRRSAEVWLREHGGRIFNDDGTGLGYDDDKIMEDYYAMKLRWLEEGISPPLDVASQHNSTENSMIVLGDVGMMLTWSNGIIGHMAAAQRPLELAPYPGPNHEKGMYLKAGMFFSIPKSSDKKEEAARFIDFFINDVEANKILNADRGVPVNSIVAEALKETVDEATVKMFDYIDFVTPHTSPIDNNHPVIAAEVLAIMEEVDEMVLYKQITPAEAAVEFRKRAEEALSR